jgi:copper homeostasis protein
VLVELCAGGIEDVELAVSLGVDRIELNSGMALGGLTPSAGLLREALAVFPGPVICMARPREGGFLYSGSERRQIYRDVEWMLSEGAAGVAAGFLDESLEVDLALCIELRRLCVGAEFVFHKAFDWTLNLRGSLQRLVDCGVDRVLTSGGSVTAIEGAGVLRELCVASEGRVEVLAGGGIQAQNVSAILRGSGCRQIHAGVRELVDTAPSPGLLHFGVPGSGERSYGRTSPEKLRELISAVRAFEQEELEV